MLLDELIRTRRTIHQFTDEKISDDLIRQALALGLWAPNHKLTFPWRWTIVGPNCRQQMADLAVLLKAEKSGQSVSPESAMSLRDALTKPSHYIALSMTRSEEAERLWEDYASVACAVQIISLYLWQNGVGSKWTTSKYSCHQKSYEIFGIDSEKEKLVGGLLVGKPMRMSNPPPGPRPDLARCLRTTL